MALNNVKPDITIISGGLDGFDDLTVRAQRSLRVATAVFYSGVNGTFPSELGPLDVPVINLDAGYYVYGSFRPQMYRDMAAIVVIPTAAKPKAAT